MEAVAQRRPKALEPHWWVTHPRCISAGQIPPRGYAQASGELAPVSFHEDAVHAVPRDVRQREIARDAVDVAQAVVIGHGRGSPGVLAVAPAPVR
jgi:hypothetical protein